MNNLKQETIADIVADIRMQNQGLPEDGYALSPLVADLLRLADRIEAAAKSIEADRDNWRRQALDEDARANATTIKDSLTVGNSAAMREALLRCDAIAQMPEIREYLIVKDMRNLIKKALSDHPRNCDVGNEKEQSDRLDAFCSKHFRYGDANPCSQCPVAAGSDSSLPCVIMDYSNVRAVCFDCARKAGFMQKKKAVIAFEEECDICKARRPCTDLHHDWINPKNRAR